MNRTDYVHGTVADGFEAVREEFAAAGKDRITLRDVLTHRSPSSTRGGCGSSAWTDGLRCTGPDTVGEFACVTRS